MIKKADLRNIDARMLISNNLVDNDYREEMESYLIKKLNPLLNIAKRDGIFERNYKKFKKNYSPIFLDLFSIIHTYVAIHLFSKTNFYTFCYIEYLLLLLQTKNFYLHKFF